MTPQQNKTIVFVSSLKDKASMNLANELIENKGFRSTGINLLGRPVFQSNSFLLCMLDCEIIKPPNLDEFFNPYAYIFLSKHSAKSRIPSLTVHSLGNFSSSVDLGGNPREVARVDPDIIKNYMLSLSKRKSIIRNYQITIEATHHGPTSLLKPALFIEIGSSEENWNDRYIAKIVIDALFESLRDWKNWEKVAIGLGGTHYPEKFNELLINSDISLAYVVPKYSLKYIDGFILDQMMRKSTKFIRYAMLDWKGLSTHKDRIIKLVEDFGLEVIKI